MNTLNLPELLSQLKALGTEQNRKTYKRHGAQEPLFGVSFANLNTFKKKIKVNHALALELWDTHNVDAMTLATMIADPQQVTEVTIDKWSSSLDYCLIADLFASFAAQTNYAQIKMQSWMKSENEYIERVGWVILERFARSDKELPDKFFENYLKIIQKEIHQRRNLTRAAMNKALIAIGVRNESLKQQALQVAKLIGRVEVDHGDTNCKTPDATSYILKA